jgi:predicted TIM-barrel fold metal-dependent hydrolase
MRTITLEEHFATAAFMEGAGKRLKGLTLGGNSRIADQLADLGEGRIREMDQAGIDMQVLSLTSPGVEGLEAREAAVFARNVNDQLVEAVRRYPDRLAGLAALPTADPKSAVSELERTVKEYGFKGAVINGHIGGRYLDDAYFWPILEGAEALEVPLYLHPAMPPQPVIQTYYVGNFSAEITAGLAGAAWGWHIETAIHILRIIASGAFDRFPKLQFIIGHMGEALPFMLPRLEHTLPMQVTKLKRPMRDYLRENIYYTFSGFNYTQNFLDLMLQVGAERILFSADYPFSSMEAAKVFLEQLPISPADRERIAHGNAEHLLGM